MKEQLEQRLAELKEEFQTGQHKLQELDTESNKLQSALLRISGAVQVLEEELAKVADSVEPVSLAKENGVLTAS